MILFFFLCSSLHSKAKTSLNESERLAYKTLCNLIHNYDVKGLDNFFGKEKPTVSFKKIVNHFSKKGFTPLHRLLIDPRLFDDCAVPIDENAKFRMLEILLGVGADPNSRLRKNIKDKGFFYKGWTAVHIAIRRQKNPQIFETLRRYNGNFFLGDSEGWRPVDLIFHEANLEALKWMQNNEYFRLHDIKFKWSEKKDDLHYRIFLSPFHSNLVYFRDNTLYFRLARNLKNNWESSLRQAAAAHDDKVFEHQDNVEQSLCTSPSPCH